jgi:sulfide dehydrogenase cytochrome subunit
MGNMRLFFALIATAGVSAPALSEVGQPGRLLASNCFQCHGTNGRGSAFDPLAGLSASETFKKLKEMKAGKEGNGIMPRHAMIYTDAQLQQIAGWFASQK